MWLNSNNIKNILKEISHIQFPNLAIVILQATNIESIEVINRIHMPKLIRINISSNKFSKVGMLKKSLWGKIQLASLADNNIVDGNELTKMVFAEKNLIFALDFDNTERCTCQDLSFLAKLPTSKINSLYLQYQNRIRMPNLKSVIEKKYLSIYP